ncbi:MAG: hypothetical protein LBP85_10015 [Prevotellaceae bacterium]|nr:hypothetical protein [Prevotellaceae bacterium]
MKGDTYNVVSLYIIDSVETEKITTTLNSFNIKYSLDAGDFKKSCIENQSKISIHSLDEMLRQIENKNIKYLILPSIRLNPQKNTGQIVNTLNRYIDIINMKYPDRFFVIHKIGTSEICELVEYAPDGKPARLEPV